MKKIIIRCTFCGVEHSIEVSDDAEVKADGPSYDLVTVVHLMKQGGEDEG